MPCEFFTQEMTARATENRRHGLLERQQKGNEKRYQTFDNRAVPADERREGPQARVLKRHRGDAIEKSKAPSKGRSKPTSKGTTTSTDAGSASVVLTTAAEETRVKLRNMELGATHRTSEHPPSTEHQTSPSTQSRTKTAKIEPQDAASITLSSPTTYSSSSGGGKDDKDSWGHSPDSHDYYYGYYYDDHHYNDDHYDDDDGHWNHYNTKSGKSGGRSSGHSNGDSWGHSSGGSDSYDHHYDDDDHHDDNDHWNHYNANTKAGKSGGTKTGKTRKVSTGVCNKRLHLAFEQITDLGPGEGPFGVVTKPSDVTDLCEFMPPTKKEKDFNFGCPFLYVPEFGFLEGEEEYVAIFGEEAGMAFQSFVLYCQCHQGFELGCAAKVPHGPPTTTREYTSLSTGEMEMVTVNGYSDFIPFGKPADRIEYCKLAGVWNGDFDKDILSDLDQDVVDCGCFFIGQAQDMVDQCPGVELGAFFEFPSSPSPAPTTVR